MGSSSYQKMAIYREGRYMKTVVAGGAGFIPTQKTFR